MSRNWFIINEVAYKRTIKWMYTCIKTDVNERKISKI